MTEFNPEAVDGDGDGLVQEGTEFERFAEPVEEVAAEPVAPKKAPAGFVYVLDGEGYEAVAERIGIDPEDLYKLNNENPIYAGSLLRKK
jgi:hypothetical protein